MKTVWITFAVVLCVGVLFLAIAPHKAKDDGGASDYEDLAACAFLTSLDSTKSLYLSRSHVVRQSETGGNGTQFESGVWQLVDDDKPAFKVTIAGRDTVYTLVSAPEGEGCMLVPGDPSKADLTKAWYSTLQDPR